MADPAVAQNINLVDLPAGVLGCIVRHVQQHDLQHDQRLSGVAALRSVCRSLRLAVDCSVTHASFHKNVGATELREVTRRCTGLHTVKLQQLYPDVATATLDALAALPKLCTLDMPMYEDMRLDDWTRLSGLAHLTLRAATDRHRGTLVAVLPRLTALRSLALDYAYALPLADVRRFSTLTRLTHLDLGRVEGVAALAPQLPALQSLALHLSHAQTPDALVGQLAPLLPLTRLTWLSTAARMGSFQDVRMTLDSSAPLPTDATHKEGAACGGPAARDAVLPRQGMQHLAALQGIRAPAALQLASRPPDAPPGRPQHEACTPGSALRELRLTSCVVRADLVADLAPAVGRLRVLHLVRCYERLAPLIQAAVAVEDVSLRGAQGGGELLAALGPAARTLTALDATDLSGQLSGRDADSLAALTGLTRLAYGCRDGGFGACGAIAQLTRLRALSVREPAKFDDAQLAQLSALRSLTSLTVAGWSADVTGGWLTALAAGNVPLRELRLCNGAVVPGCGAEAAIGRLTCLTSLHLSFDTASHVDAADPMQQTPRLRRRLTIGPPAPLQLQLLGCSGAATTGAGGGGDTAARRDAGLQELSLECTWRLSDRELAAAAAAAPDLRRLEVVGQHLQVDRQLLGFSGAGLAAFSACRRLREVSLAQCGFVEGHQLLEHLPQVGGLASLQLVDCPRVGSTVTQELQAAFQAAHGRHLHVKLQSFQ